jgi:hypothetical protein
MHKKYRVTLTLAEREELERLLARGKADVRKIKHAQILLKADEAESGPKADPLGQTRASPRRSLQGSRP